MPLNVIYLAQVHSPTVWDDPQNDPMLKEIVLSQHNIAQIILKNPNALVISEEADVDYSAENIERRDLTQEAKQLFPNGIPNNIDDLTNDQAIFLAKRGADFTLFYLGVLKTLYSALPPDFNQFVLHAFDNEYISKSYREELAFQKLVRLNKASGTNQTDVYLTYGLGHNFEYSIPSHNDKEIVFKERIETASTKCQDFFKLSVLNDYIRQNLGYKWQWELVKDNKTGIDFLVSPFTAENELLMDYIERIEANKFYNNLKTQYGIVMDLFPVEGTEGPLYKLRINNSDTLYKLAKEATFHKYSNIKPANIKASNQASNASGSNWEDIRKAMEAGTFEDYFENNVIDYDDAVKIFKATKWNKNIDSALFVKIIESQKPALQIKLFEEFLRVKNLLCRLTDNDALTLVNLNLELAVVVVDYNKLTNVSPDVIEAASKKYIEVAHMVVKDDCYEAYINKQILYNIAKAHPSLVNVILSNHALLKNLRLTENEKSNIASLGSSDQQLSESPHAFFQQATHSPVEPPREPKVNANSGNFSPPQKKS